MNNDPILLHRVGDGSPPSAEVLMHRVARGDESAFSGLYDLLAASTYGVIRRVVRDPAQAEEVTQEVLVEVWRTASRFDAERGSASTWVLTVAHRRAVDRVRSEQAASNREQRAAARDPRPPYDEVVEEVTARLEHEQVRRCMAALTELQLEAVTLAYYAGYTYREVASLLDATSPLSRRGCATGSLGCVTAWESGLEPRDERQRTLAGRAVRAGCTARTRADTVRRTPSPVP